MVAAGAHVTVIGSHLAEAPYMGVLFVVLNRACSVLAVAALLRGGRAGYLLAVLTPAVRQFLATRRPGW